jgi:RNA polymerase sigma-70 factor, ECF subfamily
MEQIVSSPVSFETGPSAAGERQRPARAAKAELSATPTALHDTSEALAQRCGAGDAEAFGSLVERHTDRVFNLLWQWTGNRADAEDLTQETFVRAFAGMGRFDSRRAFRPWLLTIARRAAASHWRKARPTEPLGEHVAEPASLETPASRLTAAEDDASIWALARKLKPRQFQVLWLRYGEGLEVPDIARILGITRIHVKVLLHRARTALAHKLP